MTRVAAHRGGARLWAENSLLGFRNALALGCDLIELDVHPTADGGLAVIHDPTLDRTTDATGRVTERTAAELSRVRLRGPDGALTGEHVPMLDEVLALLAASRAGVLVEVKGPDPGVAVAYEAAPDGPRIVPGARYEGLEERAVAALRRAGLLARANVMSFNPEVLARIRRVAPGLRTTLLVAAAHVRAAKARPEDTIAWARRFEATDAGLEHTLVDAAVVAAARRHEVLLGVWTANDEAEMRRLVGLGVDVLTSDRPDLARRVVGG